MGRGHINVAYTCIKDHTLYVHIHVLETSARFERAMAHGITVRHYMMGLYYGIILQDYVREEYYKIILVILRRYITADILQQVYDARCITAGIFQQICFGR